MSNIERDYLKELYGFSQELGGIELSFTEKKLEEGFRKHFLQHELTKSRFFCIISLILYASSIYSNLSRNDYKMFYLPYIIIGAIALEIILYVFTQFNKTSSILINLKYIRFFIIYAIMMINVIFPVGNPTLDVKVRTFYRSLVGVNIVFLYYIDFNIIILILLPILNLVVILYIQYTQEFEKYYLLPDLVGNLIFNVFIYYLKKNELKMKKDCFFEIFKNEQYISYVKKLIDALNTMFLSVKSEKDMMFMNRYASNFFKVFSNKSRKVSSSILLSEVFKENENLIDNNKNNHEGLEKSNINLEIFLESLFLVDEGPNAGKHLNEILSEINNVDENDSEVFNRLGFFEMEQKGMKNFFEIYARKLKHTQNIAELLLYDVTEIKTAEKEKVESKYKQKILAKIAHEFKTPLMSIIGLINKIGDKQRIQNCSNCGNIYTKDLNHIQNLSNYIIVLISDIIQYVAGSKDLRHNKSEINLREIINFCFEVLTTLVECSESKKGLINTEIKYDHNLDNYKIISDENRIKQIILNFVSNAVKFTKNGSIKISAYKLPERDCVKIILEDTGIGIKSEDQHLIFQENIKLNLEENYNMKGSGLGLSICKNIANCLGHQLEFSSCFEEGSKFWILIECEKKEIVGVMDIKNQSVDVINIEKENQFRIINRKNPRTISFHLKSKDPRDLSISNQGGSTRREKYLILREDIFKEIDNYEYEFDINLGALVIDRFQLNFEMFTSGFNYLVVVDDQRLVRRNTVNLIKIVISSMRINNLLIIEAVDGLDLLNIVRRDKEKSIKCIFTDENMDYINGSEAVKIIRNMEDKNKINHYHIISITAFDDSETKNQIIKSGINSVIIKPCTKTSIINIFKSLGIGNT